MTGAPPESEGAALPVIGALAELPSPPPAGGGDEDGGGELVGGVVVGVGVGEDDDGGEVGLVVEDFVGVGGLPDVDGLPPGVDAFDDGRPPGVDASPVDELAPGVTGSGFFGSSAGPPPGLLVEPSAGTSASRPSLPSSSFAD